MNRGDAVYISGYSVGQERALVTLADSSAAATMPAIAILEDSSLANNATGHFIETGNLADMDTNSWNVGDNLYISETGTTGNTLTNTKPTGTALVQRVAVVLRKHASNGVIEIFGAGRSNDLPNIANTKIWIGDSSGVPQEFALSKDATMTAGGVVTIVSGSFLPTGLSGAFLPANISGAFLPTSVSGAFLPTAVSGAFATMTQVSGSFLPSAVSGSFLPTAVSGAFLQSSTSGAFLPANTSGAFMPSAVSGAFVMTLDRETQSGAYVANMIFGTGATPPTASGFTKGSIYVQYTP